MTTTPQESSLDEIFLEELFAILEETFETHHGIYLDKNTSLFETLDEITAEQASLVPGNDCATIAAKIEHVIFYLEVLEQYLLGQDVGSTDWSEIWGRVTAVTPAEWNDLKARLRLTYDHIRKTVCNIDNWGREDTIGDALAIVVHTAYHLGEIRQAIFMNRGC